MADEILNPNNGEQGVTGEKDTGKVIDNDALLDKLDSIIEKRIDGLAKSILKDNGVEDAELKDILSQYKTNKAAKAKENTDAINNLKLENEKLKSQILDGKLNDSALKIGEQLNINNKYIKQVLKLADLSNVSKDGEIDEDKLNEAMAKVIEECDVFKTTSKKEESGFKSIGAKNSTDEPSDSVKQMRRALGLK